MVRVHQKRGAVPRGSAPLLAPSYEPSALGSLPRRPGAPLKSRERNRSPAVERDPFPLEEATLHEIHRRIAGAQADAPLRVDNSVPGETAALFEHGQSVADEPRVTRQTSQARDLAVGRHTASRDPRDDRIDPPVGALGLGHGSQNTNGIIRQVVFAYSRYSG